MKLFTIALVFAVTVTLAVCNYCTIEVKPNPDKGKANCFGRFSKYADVFGIRIYGTSDAQDCWVKQQAFILYGLLDNNYDGVVDYPELLKAQLDGKRGKTIGVFKSADDKSAYKFEKYPTADNEHDLPCDGLTGMSFVTEDQFDGNQYALQEETIHMLVDNAYQVLHVDAFGTQGDSSLALKAMDVARGGKFKEVPDKYPDGAWYTYLEKGCDYNGCQVGEYIWHLIAAYYNLQVKFPEYCTKMKGEWTICSREELKTKDKLGYALVSDPKYHIPTKVPEQYKCDAAASKICPLTYDGSSGTTGGDGGSGGSGNYPTLGIGLISLILMGLFFK